MCKNIAAFLFYGLNKAYTGNLKFFRIQKEELKPCLEVKR